MATPEQVAAGMKAQLDLAAKGTSVPLTEALIRIGILTPVLRENIEKVVGSRRTGPGQFSQYKLLDKLGEGGMGEVYLAEDTAAGRKVAIKVLPRKYSDDPEFVARFRREAEAASKLRHANIVGAYATGLELGYCFYVMEYGDGEPLD
ncbi:MAG TPA: protein kinase [Planctomycetota bacterium]|nr:protein kinase [Planctomycetota bacterium]